MTPTQSPRSIAPWRFSLPLALQTGLFLAIPAGAFYTHLTGRTVTLQTEPIDPYDLMRGYSVTLNYTISNTAALQKLPGWQSLPRQVNDYSRSTDLAPNTELFVILQAPAGGSSPLPQPWKPVAVTQNRPKNLPENQIALRGVAGYSRVAYGLETYYIPEDQRGQINQDISEAQRLQGRRGAKATSVVDIKVNASGGATPLGLWLDTNGAAPGGVRNYRF